MAPDPIYLDGMTRMKVFYRKVELTAKMQENRKFGGCLPGSTIRALSHIMQFSQRAD